MGILIVLIIIYPFLHHLMHDSIKYIDDVYTYGLSLNEFYTHWIGLWGFVGVIIGIFQVQKRNNTIIEYNQKQLDIQNKQIQQQNEQIKLQIQRDIRERYQACVQLLESDSEISRLNAINNLYLIAKEHSNSYLEIVCNTFCDIVRSNKFILAEDNISLPQDIQKIINYLFRASPFIFDDCVKNLNNVKLLAISLNNAHIKNTNFNGATFVNCIFNNSAISDSYFNSVSIRSTLFKTCKIKHSFFRNSIFEDTQIIKSEIFDVLLSQSMLNGAIFSKTRVGQSDFSNTQINDSIFANVKFDTKCIFEYKELRRTRFAFPDSIYLSRFVKLLPIRYQYQRQEGNIVVFE